MYHWWTDFKRTWKIYNILPKALLIFVTYFVSMATTLTSVVKTSSVVWVMWCYRMSSCVSYSTTYSASRAIPGPETTRAISDVGWAWRHKTYVKMALTRVLGYKCVVPQVVSPVFCTQSYNTRLTPVLWHPLPPYCLVMYPVFYKHTHTHTWIFRANLTDITNKLKLLWRSYRTSKSPPAFGIL